MTLFKYIQGLRYSIYSEPWRESLQFPDFPPDPPHDGKPFKPYKPNQHSPRPPSYYIRERKRVRVYFN